MTSPLRGPALQLPARGEGFHGAALPATARRPEPAPVAPRSQSAAAAAQGPTPRGEEALRAALAAADAGRSAVRYRGFVLLPQPDLGWLVRPERSPMTVLPFRTPPISLSDLKALVDWRLQGAVPRLPESAEPSA